MSRTKRSKKISGTAWGRYRSGCTGKNLSAHYSHGIIVFMSNYSVTAFARNDHATFIAMAGSLAGSLFNIVFDYIFIFPAGLGFSGAALATANARPAIIGSLLRGVIAIVICAVVLAGILGMNGVWLSFLASEMITFVVILSLSRKKASVTNDDI